ncbi:hypothetical protein DSECCO2_599630 [anaerobic digester metagenome]
MNAESIRKEIHDLKNAIPSKQDDLSIYDRMQIYEEIFGSTELAAYKKAMAEGRQEDALNIYLQIPEDRAELFMNCYEWDVNYFDKLDAELKESAGD